MEEKNGGMKKDERYFLGRKKHRQASTAALATYSGCDVMHFATSRVLVSSFCDFLMFNIDISMFFAILKDK